MSKEGEIRQRAMWAQQLADNPVYSEIINLMKAKVIKDLTKRNFLQKRTILGDQMKLKVINDFERLLVRYIQDGTRVERDSARLNK